MTEEAKQALSQPFTELEVKYDISSMSPLKSPARMVIRLFFTKNIGIS